MKANQISSTFKSSIKIQIRVIKALFLRELLTRFGRKNIGFLWLIAEPALFTLGIIGLWTFSTKSSLLELPVVAFALTGYASVLMWRNMPSRCLSAIESNRPLMYHRNVKIIDIYLSRILLELAGCTISFILLVLIFIILNIMNPPEDISKILLGWVMLAWFGASLAIFIGAMSEELNFIKRMWSPIAFISFPISGAAFMVDWLPSNVQEIVLLFPMVHGVELLREGYFGSIVNAHYDIGYMSIWCLILTLFGLSQVRKISRKISLI